MRISFEGQHQAGARSRSILVGVLCLVCVSESAWSEGFRNPPPGGAGLGHSGVFMAHVDDASAISYNPAELSRLDADTIMVSISAAETEVDFHATGFGSASSDSSIQVLPNLFASWSGKGDSAFGIGLTTPFGQSSEWDKDTVLKYSAPYFVEMQLLNINPTFSTRLSERVRFGAGFDLYVSSMRYKQLADNGPLPGDGSIDLEADGTGLGGNVGLSWDVSAAQRLALTYRSSVRVEYEGDARIQGIPLPIPASDELRSSITFPAIVGLGYGVTISDTFRMELDVEWLEYSVNDSIPLDALAYNSTVLPQEIINDWKDSWTIGVGGDWQFAEQWTLYAGYTFLESPIPDETFSPSTPDADRHAFSLGVGFENDVHALDLAVTASIYDDRDVDGSQTPGLDGEYDIESRLVELSYTYNF